jgi:hypothetical protein
MVMERVPAEDWEQHAGHVARYRYASAHVRAGESVNDVACGSGYGSLFLLKGPYSGYDMPGVPDPTFPGSFHAADLDDPSWLPEPADVTVCFETLEHVKDPAWLARVIAATTRRAVFVSVPVVPTKHLNPHHLHDFTVSDIPELFPGWTVAGDWPQPEELSHVWMLVRTGVPGA